VWNRDVGHGNPNYWNKARIIDVNQYLTLLAYLRENVVERRGLWVVPVHRHSKLAYGWEMSLIRWSK
jgi:hypothetical protein